MESAGHLSPQELVNDQYRVVDLIGEGEMSELYEADDLRTGRSVALKVFGPQVTAAAWSAYESAVRASAHLLNPSIVRVEQLGTIKRSGLRFTVTERLRIPPLDLLLPTVGPLVPAQLSQLLNALAPAFDAAHRAGIVHRQIKPQNLFVGVQDLRGARITDFAVTALRLHVPPPPGWAATPGWIGPDAADPRVVSQPTMDVYSLGLVSFFALTGRSPFLSLHHAFGNLDALWTEMLEPMAPASERAAALGAALSPSLNQWFAKLLVPKPDARFQTVGEMAAALSELIRHEPSLQAPRPTNPELSPALSRPGVLAASVQPLVFLKKVPGRGSPSGGSGADAGPASGRLRSGEPAPPAARGNPIAESAARMGSDLSPESSSHFGAATSAALSPRNAQSQRLPVLLLVLLAALIIILLPLLAWALW